MSDIAVIVLLGLGAIVAVLLRAAPALTALLERLWSPQGEAVMALHSRSALPTLVPTLVLLGGLWVILSQEYDTATEKWAYGIVGLIVGAFLPTSDSQ